MIISLSPAVYSATEPVVLPLKSIGNLPDMARRSSRVATLDGGAVLTDYGYTDADRTWNIDLGALDEAVVGKLQALIKNESQIVAATAEGCFLGSLQSLGSRGGIITITFLPVERLDA
ncbi:MAG: hypothetical protein KAT62_00780 [Desulfuromonadales bacterium]|nr:hypothetical protein [Desulfuromonadales bacterium]